LSAISFVFTIAYVAKMLGEDEGWLHDLSIDMFPEDGCLHVYTGEDDGITAFTDDGIENLKHIIANMRADGRAPRRTAPTEWPSPRYSPEAYPTPIRAASSPARHSLAC